MKRKNLIWIFAFLFVVLSLPKNTSACAGTGCLWNMTPMLDGSNFTYTNDCSFVTDRIVCDYATTVGQAIFNHRSFNASTDGATYRIEMKVNVIDCGTGSPEPIQFTWENSSSVDFIGIRHRINVGTSVSFANDDGVVPGNMSVFEVGSGWHTVKYDFMPNASLRVNVDNSENNLSVPYGSAKGNFSHWKVLAMNSCNTEVTNISIFNLSAVASVEPDTFPVFKSNSTNTTNIKINEIGQFNINVSDDIGISTIIFSWNNTGNFVNITNFTQSTGTITSLNQSFNQTITRKRGEVIGYHFFVNDTINQFSSTSIQTFTIADTTPTFTLGINNTSPKINEIVQISSYTTDNDTLSMVIASWNCTSARNWINISNSTSDSTGLNYSVNSTILSRRNSVCGWLFYSNDSVSPQFTASSLNTFNVIDSPPTFTIGYNNTSPKINEIIQFSSLTNDSDNLSMVIFSWNGSASGLWINLSNTTVNFNQGINYSVNATLGRARANTVGFRFYSNDSISPEFNSSSLTTFVVINTPPIIPTIANASNTHVSLNKTINWTSTDADSDIINFSVYFGGGSFTTLDYNFTTNMTSETLYWLNISAFDGIAYSSNSSAWNITLDTTTPTITCYNPPTTTTYTNTNITLNCSITDKFVNTTQIQLINSSQNEVYNNITNMWVLSSIEIANHTEKLNLTQLPDGNYTLNISAIDYAFESPEIKNSKHNIKIENITYDDSESGINFSCAMTLINPVENPVTIRNLNYSIVNDKRHITTSIALDSPANTQTIRFICNSNNQQQLSLQTQQSRFVGLFHIGDRRAMHYQKYKDEGFNVTASQSLNIITIDIYPSDSDWSNHAINGRVITNSSLFGGLFKTESQFTLLKDTSLPIFANAFNRTAGSNTTSITTATDVNLTIYGIGDSNIATLNISHNATGTWTNHSIAVNGNGTYHMVISRNNLTSGEVVGWKFDVFDLAGNQLDPVYTFEAGSPATETVSGTAAGGSSGAGNPILSRCDPISQSFNTCYYYNQEKSLCMRGCPTGYLCSGIRCDIAQGEIQQAEEKEELLNRFAFKNPFSGLWQKIKGFFANAFDTSSSLSIQQNEIAQKAVLSSAENAISSAKEETQSTINAVKQKPIIAFVAIGIVGMAVGFIYLGAALLIPPFLFYAAGYWLIVLLIWLFEVF